MTTAGKLKNANIGHVDDAIEVQDIQFRLPELPLPVGSSLKHRYDPFISQLTNLLMKDGKLSRAQWVRYSGPLYLKY